MHFPSLLLPLIQAAKDRFLALAVCGLLVIDFVILITYTVVAGLLGQLGAKEIPNGENPMDITGVSNDVIVSPL